MDKKTDKRRQILFRENISKDYPHVDKFFTELTGNDRAKAFMAMAEAFMVMSDSVEYDAATSYHLAESVRKGWSLNKDMKQSSIITPAPIQPEPATAPTPQPAYEAPTKSADGDMNLEDFLNS